THHSFSCIPCTTLFRSGHVVDRYALAQCLLGAAGLTLAQSHQPTPDTTLATDPTIHPDVESDDQQRRQEAQQQNGPAATFRNGRSEEHTSELQSRAKLV